MKPVTEFHSVRNPDGFRKVVRSSHKNCVIDPVNGRQFLPDDLSEIGGTIIINGDTYIPFYYLDSDRLYAAYGCHEVSDMK